LMYGNEAGVGKAIRASGLPREEIFVTTKLWNSDQGYDSAMRAFDASLERLGLDYIDLYLIHWPVPGKYKQSYRALERLYDEGRVKAIGVANFLVHHLIDLMQSSSVVPAVNQFEYHPYLQQPELVDFCYDNDIQVEAWAPIMRGKVNEIPTLIEISQKYNKTAVQITLRWLIDTDVVAIPKSAQKDRIQSNSDIFDFSLDDDEIERINRLDKGQPGRLGPHPDHFDF